MKNLRKKDAEIHIIKIWNNQNKKNEEKLNNTIIILKVFFEILDMLECTNHLMYIEQLYLTIGGGRTHFETFAQDLHVDVSTLRRYRSKYIKVIEYLAACSESSYTFELLQILGKT